MAVTTEVALGGAANVRSCALSLIRTRLPAQRSQKLHLFRFPTPTSESSGVFSLFCGLLRTFCTRDPLFSTLSELFCQKQGVGVCPSQNRPSHAISNQFECARQCRFYRCLEAAGNTVCWDGGIGTSPLRSLQRMEFNTWLLASSAWRQSIAADALAPGAVAALLLKMSPLRRLLSSASKGCCVAAPENSPDMIGAYASL